MCCTHKAAHSIYKLIDNNKLKDDDKFVLWFYLKKKPNYIAFNS